MRSQVVIGKRGLFRYGYDQIPGSLPRSQRIRITIRTVPKIPDGPAPQVAEWPQFGKAPISMMTKTTTRIV